MRLRLLAGLAAVALLASSCTMLAWGDNGLGQLGTGDIDSTTAPGPSAGATWSSVESGNGYSCGVRADGTAWCWGSNSSGRLGVGVDDATLSHSAIPRQVGSGTDWVQIDGRENHTCGVRSDGSAWCWGYNGLGQLGDGTTIASNVPVAVVGGATLWASVEVGDNTTCAIGTDGTAWCWGHNDFGQLGNGTTADSTTPIEVSGNGPNWATITTADAHTCATRTDGTAWCWGSQHNGRLGDGTASASGRTDTPVEVSGGASNWSSVTTGDSHTCATRTDGSAWCWGRNADGQLGSTTTDFFSALPALVAGGATDWSMTDAGDSYTCATRTDGTAWCWGSNTYGELGDGTMTSGGSFVPVPLAGGYTDWVSISAGPMRFHFANCGIRSGGTAWCWGWNFYGQFGDGNNDPTQNLPPVQVESNIDWVQLAARDATSCKRTATLAAWPWDGTVSCWGDNSFGQLGTGDTLDRTNPTPLLGNWDDIAVGSRHTCGIKIDGSAWCWGNNADGQLGDGSTSDSTVPVEVDGDHTDWTTIAAGGAHTCGLRGTTAYCWGHNSTGQLGNGTATDQSVPTAVSSSNSFASITAGTAHTCAIRDDASLRCWGANGSGQIGNGTVSTAFSPSVAASGGAWKFVAAGGDFTCAIGVNRAIFCWGDNGSGQLGDGTTTNRRGASAIAGGLTGFNSLGAGTDHICAIQSSASPNALWCWGDNSSGQLGDGTTTDRSTPTQVGAGTQWFVVAGGSSHTVGIEA